MESKRNDTGLRIVLEPPEDGQRGWLIWREDPLSALIDWNDEVVAHRLGHCITSARLVQRCVSREYAAEAERQDGRSFVQLAPEGLPLLEPTPLVGRDLIGADLGPSTIALVPQAGEASLSLFGEERAENAQTIRWLQRRRERQRRAAKPDTDEPSGRMKKQRKKRRAHTRAQGDLRTVACRPSPEPAWQNSL